MKFRNLVLALTSFIACPAFDSKATAPVFPPDNTNLCFWSLSDTNTWTSDCGSSPLGFTNLSWSNLGDGPALVVDSTNPAWLNFACVDTDGWTNLTVDTGSVVIWYAPYWSSMSVGGTGPGASARLLQVGEYTADASYGFWGLSIDPTGSNVCFSAQGNDGSQIMYLSAPISWTTNRWHQLVLTYSSTTNSALYIDGTFVTNGPVTTILPSASVQSHGFFLGSDTNGWSQMQGMMDDVATYDYPLDADSIASMYLSSGFVYYINPLNEANVTQLTSAPSYTTNSPTFRAVMGQGYLKYLGAAPSCVTNRNIWLTNLTAKAASNGTMNLFFTVQGGDPTLVYDVYGTPALMPGNITNAQWYWLGQVSTCSQYELTNLPPTAADVLLGWPTDADGDGLPNAFESLVSKTDPTSFDTYGTGMADWFQYLYSSGGSVIDPYALCPSGDGYSFLQAYQNGYNPRNFYTPAAPVATSYITPDGLSRVIQWQPALGNIQSYSLVKYHVFSGGYWQSISTQSFSAGTTNFTDTNIQPPQDDPDINPSGYRDAYELYAVYPSNQVSSAGIIMDATLDLRLIHGPGAAMQLALFGVPSQTTAIRLYFSTNASCGWGLGANQTIDIPVSSFTNNLYPFTDQQYPLYVAYQISAQAVVPAGFAGVARVVELDCQKTIRYPFLDATRVLKDNLLFTLQSRAADDPTNDFDILAPLETEGIGYGFVPGYVYPGGTAFEVPVYAASSYRAQSAPPEPNLTVTFWGPDPLPLRPWQITAYDWNHQATNGLLSPCFFVTNCDSFEIPTCFAAFDETSFVSAQTTVGCAPILSSPTNRVVVGIQDPMTGIYALDPVTPIIWDGNYNDPATIMSVHPNAYGLQFLGVGDPVAGFFRPGDVTYNWPDPELEEFAAPVLQKVGYVFTRAGQLSDVGADRCITNGGVLTTNFLFASVGQTDFSVSPWLRYRLINGTPGVYAYAEQYFDYALKMDSAGSASSNQTGVVSPYGYFFPTEPGQVALITKTNIEDGGRGTGIVNVVSLALDANHNGTIDTSFYGQDFTTPSRPFQFWINNNYDRLAYDTDDGANYDDDVETNNDAALSGFARVPAPDFNYADRITDSREIPCIRDLQDFARLWVCGMAPNVLTSLPTNTVITLSWGDVANTNAANPTIDLFIAADVDGGMGYLTNQLIGSQQVNTYQCPYVGRLAPGGSILLSVYNPRTGLNWLGDHFIWCGVSNGVGALTMTISIGGTDVLGTAMAYVKLTDIKQMYERWTIGDSPKIPGKTLAQPAQEDVASPFQYGLPSSSNTPYILFVHGWNMDRWDKDRFAESAFKRLYWQGYEGRFGSFRWPTDYGFEGISTMATNITEKNNFDRSEWTAWRSGGALLTQLRSLNAMYPGTVYMLAHSMGNIVASEALRLSGATQVVNTYISSQAALSAHTYDPSIASYSFSYPPWSASADTPNIYGSWFATNFGAGAASVVSFYNTNDYALQRSIWQLNQLFKPDHNVLLGSLHWNYSYNGTTNDPPPWNHFMKVDTTGIFGGDLDITVLTNRYEIMSFAAQSWTTALGATPAVRHTLPDDLMQVWPSDLSGKNYAQHFWHSAEFRGDYWQQQNYWSELLGPNGLKIKLP